MKIKTRLYLYNILIVVISIIILTAIFIYINKSSADILYNVDTITVDENANAVKLLLESNVPYKLIDINLKKFNYKLSIYENKKLVYGEENKALENVLKKYRIKSTTSRILLIDNTTIVMRTDGNRVYFAVHEKFLKGERKFTNRIFNPFRRLLIKIVIIILFSISLVIVCAVLFSKDILNQVMHPLQLLKDGATRVENGNFENEIVYQKDDEFLPVVDNFNDMQKSLKQKTEKAKKYEEAKREMINGISHDIRTPLTVVKGNIKAIKDGVATTKEKQDKYLDTAYNRAQDIENLLDRLFDTFKYETGQIKLNREKVDIVSFVEDILNSNENVVNNIINLEFSSDIESETLYIDKIQFKRVFDNLINNAVKHNKDKEDLKIEVKIFKQDKLVKISFKDNGKGVNEENIPKLFDEFFKEDESRNDDKTGSGIGLFIVKNIIESHDGEIIAENRDGLYYECSLKGEE